MSYRGEDLDLRTPQTAPLASTEPAPTAGGRAGPIWVDETVLACSNYAYDVAVAHRAGEVRLEHLLHALTRIEAAADALEARGVRVGALRRDSATIIASEIPVGLPNGKGTPRRSEEFAEILRLAALNASRRNAPAGIEDLLYVLFDQRADLPGLGLLVRHTIRAVREAEPMTSVPRYVTEPRYLTATRVDAGRYGNDVVRTYRTDFSSSPTDSIQNSRLDALEQMVRALSSDLSNERQIVSNLLKELNAQTLEQRTDQSRLQSTLADRLGLLERAVSETRTGGPGGEALQDQLLNFEASVEQRLSDLSRTWGNAIDRLQAIESGLEQRLSEAARSWNALSERLQALDKSVRERPGQALPVDFVERMRGAIDLKPVLSRLDIIEEALLSADGAKGNEQGLAAFSARIEERLKWVEQELVRVSQSGSAGTERIATLVAGMERQRGEAMSALMQPIVERVSSVVGAAQGQQGPVIVAMNAVVERLSGVERALTAEIETAAAKHQAYTNDLSEVHDALMKLNQNQHTLAGSIDQWRSDAAGDLSVISNRLTSLDRDNERPIETLAALSAHMDNMNTLMIERYHRRNRFWYWLFGTDDWIGASWPSQAAALQTERDRFKAPKP